MRPSYEDILTQQLSLLERLQPLMSQAVECSDKLGECDHLLGFELLDVTLLTERVEERLNATRQNRRLNHRQRRQR